VAVLAYASGREDQRRYETPASYAKAAKADAQSACAGREGTAAFECVYEKVEAAQEQARAEQDLSAQQKAANSALLSALIAFFTLILTGVGVWYIKRTLEATLKAVEDTSEATDAMREANRMALLAQRPWLSVEIVPTILKRQGHALRCEIEINVTNLGQSVAKNYLLFSKLKYTPSGSFDEAEEIFETFAAKLGNTRRVVLPRDTERTKYWSYQSIDFLPWAESEAADKRLAVLFVVSAFYQSELTGDKWHRVDKAIWVARKTENGQLNATITRGYRGVRSDLLVADPLTNGTLIT
jgi:hypothetical protein